LHSAFFIAVLAPRLCGRAKSFFDEALPEGHRLAGTSEATDLFIAFFGPSRTGRRTDLAGLYFTDTINLKGFTATFLLGPPPFPPAAPAAGAIKS